LAVSTPGHVWGPVHGRTLNRGREEASAAHLPAADVATGRRPPGPRAGPLITYNWAGTSPDHLRKRQHLDGSETPQTPLVLRAGHGPIGVAVERQAISTEDEPRKRRARSGRPISATANNQPSRDPGQRRARWVGHIGGSVAGPPVLGPRSSAAPPLPGGAIWVGQTWTAATRLAIVPHRPQGPVRFGIRPSNSGQQSYWSTQPATKPPPGPVRSWARPNLDGSDSPQRHRHGAVRAVSGLPSNSGNLFLEPPPHGSRGRGRVEIWQASVDGISPATHIRRRARTPHSGWPPTAAHVYW